MSDKVELENPGATGDFDRKRQWRSRLTMIGLFMTFFGPIFLAMFLYSHLEIWRPAKLSNHGDLLVPVSRLKMLRLTENDTGETVTLDTISPATESSCACGPSGCNPDTCDC